MDMEFGTHDFGLGVSNEVRTIRCFKRSLEGAKALTCNPPKPKKLNPKPLKPQRQR